MDSNFRPYTLSIAGFDPSGGAGLIADVKTFEMLWVYGLGVVSALTIQNDIAFEEVQWIPIEQILKQVSVLRQRFDVRYVKIGLMENMGVALKLIRALHEMIENPVIIYDPILKASAGYEFYEADDTLLDELLDKVYCITPNIPEAHKLFGENKLHEKLLGLSDKVNVYLKGGHGNGDIITDTLYCKGMIHTFTNEKLPHGEKHGSGCVLSAALTAHLALGNDLVQACEGANSYTHHFLASNDTLLGYHYKNIEA